VSALLSRIVATLGELSAAVAAAVIAAAILDLALRRAPWPELRAVPWLLVLARLLIPPGFASPVALLPGLGLAAPTSAYGSGASALPVPPDSLAAGATPLPAPILDRTLVALWLAGAICLAIGAARRHLGARDRLLARALPALPEEWRAAARSAQARLGLRRLPRIAAIPGLPGAMVLGALRPVVLLPARLPAADAARREHVLLHELAHVKRRDPLLGALSATLQVIFWFHPLLWFARRRLALVVELCADAEVARALGREAPEYRRTLLAAAGRASGVLPAGSLGFLARRSALLERLHALERPCGGPHTLRRGAAHLLALALAVTVLPLRGADDGGGTSASGSDLAVARRFDPSAAAPDHPGCLLDRYTILGALAAAGGPSSAPPSRTVSSPAR
jgi:beta-lactamase regulating signal transducer with metallopeptidase domain